MALLQHGIGLSQYLGIRVTGQPRIPELGARIPHRSPSQVWSKYHFLALLQLLLAKLQIVIGRALRRDHLILRDTAARALNDCQSHRLHTARRYLFRIILRNTLKA